MCSCEFNYTCSKCKGTPHDPQYLELCAEREEELDRRLYGFDATPSDKPEWKIA